MILVGCKADLRPPGAPAHSDDPNLPYITEEQGKQVSIDIGARAYRECSALQTTGVDDVFEAATRASMLVRGDGAKTTRRASSTGADDSKSGCCVVC